MSRARRLSALTLLIAIVGIPAALRGAGPIGLSSVRAVELPDVAFAGDPVEAGDHYGAALATGDFNGDGAADLVTGAPDGDGGQVSGHHYGAVLVRLGEPGLGLASGAPARLLSGSASGGEFGSAFAVGDFNGDGFEDLAIADPGNRNHAGQTGYGRVWVYYGSANLPLFAVGTLVLDAAVAGSGVDSGHALAAGDFNGDGFDDLAIGCPRYSGSGKVVVVFGEASGLTGLRETLAQGSGGASGSADSGDNFGFALTSGDFDADGYDDLAVGIPQDDDWGSVQVFFGVVAGIDPAQDLLLTQNSIAGTSELGDEFGFSLATGDFDGDGKSDLAMGSPGEGVGFPQEVHEAGAVTVAFGGSETSFDLAKTQAWVQGSLTGIETSEAYDRFSEVLTAGDFDGDGYDDLAISQPYEDLSGFDDGAVSVQMGGANGFVLNHNRLLSVASQGLPGVIQHESFFGAALASGDFDGDGAADLVIGIPRQNSVELESGSEVVLYGSLYSDGFEDAGNAYWSSVAP
ncbi:MAG: FG-GAP-like repeat-containing protein [Thermoanaerobaculia bacterium]